MRDDYRPFRDRCAIAGIGRTEFSKDSGRSELTLACDRIYALDERLRPLTSGTYRVVLGVGQAGGEWFAPAAGTEGNAGDELAFDLQVH